MFAASADGQVMPMRRGQRPWDSSSRSESRSGGSLTVWNPVRALAALASSEASARSALPAAPRSNGRAVIEGTIVSRR
ncbi:heat-shock protein HspR, partial [Pauljensenia sp. UMB3104]|nr:heat-shock protein HspR [Pauljensenia sp. UMB3104]